MSKTKKIYRIIFNGQGGIYEMYARQVSQSPMYAFVEVRDLIFGERSKLVVDPSNERLKAEFSGVRSTLVPLHAIVRIDEVEKEGPNKIIPGEKSRGNVTPFPLPVSTPPSP